MSNPQVATVFEEIYNKTHRAVHVHIASKCRSTADIADIFQETYFELYRVLRKHGVGYIANANAFVLKLARRMIARHYSILERVGVLLSLNVGGSGNDDDVIDFTELCADAFVVEDFAVDQALLSTAKQFVESQPDAVQKVFYLHYEADLTIAEIAKALGMTESNVKNKLYRTLKSLRELMT